MQAPKSECAKNRKAWTERAPGWKLIAVRDCTDAVEMNADQLLDDDGKPDVSPNDTRALLVVVDDTLLRHCTPCTQTMLTPVSQSIMRVTFDYGLIEQSVVRFNLREADGGTTTVDLTNRVAVVVDEARVLCDGEEAVLIPRGEWASIIEELKKNTDRWEDTLP